MKKPTKNTRGTTKNREEDDSSLFSGIEEFLNSPTAEEILGGFREGNYPELKNRGVDSQYFTGMIERIPNVKLSDIFKDLSKKLDEMD